MKVRKRRKRRSPVARKRRRRSIRHYKSNPRRRKRRVVHMKRRHRRRKSNPSMYKRVHRRRRRKSNPSASHIMDIFINGAIGTVGALAAKTLVELVSKAASGATGAPMQPVMKNILSLVVAGGAGFLAQKFIKDQKKAEALQVGLMVYVGMQVASQFLGINFSGLNGYDSSNVMAQMGLLGTYEPRLLGADPYGLQLSGEMEVDHLLGDYDINDLA